MVFPARLLISVTVSPPFSTIYSTPRVLTASIFTPPWVLLYSTEPRLAGTAMMSSSPFRNRGFSSLALAAIRKSMALAVFWFSASSSSFTRPMDVGPFRPPTRMVTASSWGVSGVWGCLAQPVNSAAVISTASSRDTNFFMSVLLLVK